MPPARDDLFDQAERLLRLSLATRFEFSLLLEHSRNVIRQVEQTLVESQRLCGESRRLREEGRRLRADIVSLIHAGKVVDFATARSDRAARVALTHASKSRGGRGPGSVDRSRTSECAADSPA